MKALDSGEKTNAQVVLALGIKKKIGKEERPL